MHSEMTMNPEFSTSKIVQKRRLTRLVIGLICCVVLCVASTILYMGYIRPFFVREDSTTFYVKWPYGFSGAIPIVPGPMPAKFGNGYVLDATQYEIEVPNSLIWDRWLNISVSEAGAKVLDADIPDEPTVKRGFRGFILLGRNDKAWAFVGTKPEYTKFYNEASAGLHKKSVWRAR